MRTSGGRLRTRGSDRSCNMPRLPMQELIFGATDYTTAIDTWSFGCVFAGLPSPLGLPFLDARLPLPMLARTHRSTAHLSCVGLLLARPHPRLCLVAASLLLPAQPQHRFCMASSKAYDSCARSRAQSRAQAMHKLALCICLHSQPLRTRSHTHPNALKM